jgi:hypothetical protein
MTGLITCGKRIVYIAFQPKRFPTNGVHHWVTSAPQIGVFCF